MIYQLKRTDKEKPTVEQVLKVPWDKAARAIVIGSGGTAEANEDTQYQLVRLLQGFGVFVY